MAVGLSFTPEALRPVRGVALGVAEAGVRKEGRRDVAVVALAEGSVTAGVFTRNRFCAAPVVVAREHLIACAGRVRGWVINAGVANAGTGARGIEDARQCCRWTAEVLGVSPQEILPFSTGVIMEPLPMARLQRGIFEAATAVSPEGWAAAAEAIMTTDTVPKGGSQQVRLSDGSVATITGIAKGAGMIHPNMATMLAFVATDARVTPEWLRTLVAEVTEESFHAITVDGDMSTNDAFVVAATGQCGPLLDGSGEDSAAFAAALREVAVWLAQAIVRDGEGATKFVTVVVEEGRDRAECREVAFAVARSPLVKTALFASDPNLGRILAAVGAAGVEDLAPEGVWVELMSEGERVRVAERGERAGEYDEEAAKRVMQRPELTIRVGLGRGTAAAQVWTCDLSYEYVRVNAAYRS
ncbi:MAG: bifunctional glutamate N-acetyltransferase/amino-acid acetyltransferase ArgJ [Hydrogenophilus sp.]|nr:bifunctional glutamate N-acetyltransferase/amino-acid acetyltransferase ArgJ [Hydrogenophilus sp.]